jgi:hypothetical protein
VRVRVGARVRVGVRVRVRVRVGPRVRVRVVLGAADRSFPFVQLLYILGICT